MASFQGVMRTALFLAGLFGLSYSIAQSATQTDFRAEAAAIDSLLEADWQKHKLQRNQIGRASCRERV